jgi:ABC-type glycerol-3-phosphate transport system substrate-binding protein
MSDMSTTLHRRGALKLIGGVATLGLLAACSAPSSPAPTAAPAAPAKPAAAATSAPAAAPAAPTAAPAAGGKTTELVHWSWLTASDGEVWQQMIDAFNAANKDKGLQIAMEVVPDDQYGTKILASAATGNAPDFGWGTAGLRADWVKKGVVLPMDDVVKQVGLDLADFNDLPLQRAKYGGKLAMIPMDIMCLQVLLNADHAQAAGLDPSKPPQDGDTLMAWADKLTQRSGDAVTRSGWLMTGSGVQPTVVWGLVANQLGFRRASDDLKQAAVNPEAGKQAAQWVLDLFDKRKVSTRDVSDRYKAFGTGNGSMFLTGPWTLNGYVQQGLNFISFQLPKIGSDNSTYFEMGGLEMYVQKDKGRMEATAQAIKWLSDNGFLWTTKGRGGSPRKSTLARPDYKDAGNPWKVRGAFIEGLPNATVGEVPVTAGDDFTIYTGGGFAAKTMDPVWAKQSTIDDAIAALSKKWQEDLAAG